MMKPVAIFRHSSTEGPGYFSTVLDARGIPWTLVLIDQDVPLPSRAERYAGLVFMGGPMSVNDPLNWISHVMELIRGAVAAGIPVLGHCLGGQLMSKALGGTVSKNPVKEIGWGRIEASAVPQAQTWFGEVRDFLGFHWHGETFSAPPGATGIAGSAYCANQAFVMGKHLGLQCHVEMTPELVAAWCADWEKELIGLSARMPSVQTPSEMQRDLPARLDALHRVADRLYAHWIEGLVL